MSALLTAYFGRRRPRAMESIYVVLLTLLGVIVIKVLALMIICKGNWGRLMAACRAFFAVAGDDETAAKVTALLSTAKEPPKPPRLSSEPVRLLALLNRESRFLDFLLEEVPPGTSDAQLGAAVREVRLKAQAFLKEHLTFEPVLPQKENDTVEVPPGFDPSAIRLVGNVTGNPPFKGTLIHHGWRVKAYNIPKPSEGQDDLVLVQAEVELP
jgi:hypothetical protein